MNGYGPMHRGATHYGNKSSKQEMMEDFVYGESA